MTNMPETDEVKNAILLNLVFQAACDAIDKIKSVDYKAEYSVPTHIISGISKDETALAAASDTIFSPLRAFVSPATKVLFAGKVDRRGVSAGYPDLLARFVPTLDFRNWDKISDWARTLSIPDSAGQM